MYKRYTKVMSCQLFIALFCVSDLTRQQWNLELGCLILEQSKTHNKYSLIRTTTSSNPRAGKYFSIKNEDEQNRWKDDDWSQKHSNSTLRAVIVAQLVERSLPIPEVRNSNPVISKFCIEHLVTVNCIEKTKRKKKRLGMELFLKTSQLNRKCKRLHLCR